MQEPGKSTRRVVDRNGAVYELGALLGRGGQGEVYAVSGGRRAVKLLRGLSAARKEKLGHHLAFLRRLPLDDLPVARPLELLRAPHTGYVMDLIEGMGELGRLIHPSRRDEELLGWYVRTGGLRRRLQLLTSTCRVVARLHAKGLVYGDPSPANVFVSEPTDEPRVFLIDPDNLRYEGSPGTAIYSPGYGAPELVSGKGAVSTLSDAWALAILAFECLALTHPFLGDAVHEGPPEEEDKAHRGELPWIEDGEDPSNRSSLGLPRDAVLSKRLRACFARTFGAGRLEVNGRPGVSTLAEALGRAARSTLPCPRCGGTYYFDRPTCPWCEAPRPRHVLVALRLHDPLHLRREKDDHPPPERTPLVDHAAVASGESFVLTRGLAFDERGEREDEPVVELRHRDDETLGLRRRCAEPLFLRGRNEGDCLSLGEGEELFSLVGSRRSWKLHFGPPERLHRVAAFEYRKDGRS